MIGVFGVKEEDVVEVSKVVVVEEKEEDWLPPPPKKPSVNGVLSNDSTLQALRLWLTTISYVIILMLLIPNLLVVSNACHTMMFTMHVCL